jgi:predicted nucleotide-binding protein
MNNIELIDDLINQAQGIEYRNGQLDIVLKRASMLIRKIFGDSSHYLSSLKSIHFSPMLWSTGTSDSVFVNSFNRGKQELLNLLNVIKEDISLDLQLNKENKSSNKVDFTTNSNVFIVHGHNEEMKQSIARTIEKLDLTPIILHEQASKGKTIIEKFTDNSEVLYAIVLLSADDIAYLKSDPPENAKFRARQNVIFELGYFIGRLGRERVLALHQVIDDFEIPSDYSGVLFVPYDESGKWKFELVKELKAIGVNVDANKII